MNRLTRLTGLFLAVLLLLSGTAQAAGGKERIRSFDSRVAIAPDGTLTVDETIRVWATGEAIRHGLVREFPTKYKSPTGGTVTVGFRLLSVNQDGKKADYHVKSAQNGKEIYIGDKNTLVSPGEHTYRLSYETDGQLGHFAEHDELFWNVTGNGWRLPIETATATVTPPPGAKVEKFTAYTGPQGARGKDFTAEREGGSVRFATTAPLPPGQGLSVVVSWPKGFVQEPSFIKKLLTTSSSLLALGGMVTVAAYFFVAWLLVGRDPKAGTRIPLFAPPKGLSAPAARYLQRMTAGSGVKSVATPRRNTASASQAASPRHKAAHKALASSTGAKPVTSSRAEKSYRARGSGKSGLALSGGANPARSRSSGREKRTRLGPDPNQASPVSVSAASSQAGA